ncbi:bifunctional 2-polyprenyl-6-hydroxyphenol methylase/3-demethylubiquinol 3-O-methyltransferase UbiG [Hyphomicrobium sulfonivorans]|uniref:bifunctional 2-polyprenyl-6-hydroxyphenol methylase/3-demethylubiquinol 3-O-methyltransferase UbiG n=1 Tax=Hyphomicrobium sulfonivorans TaxID=121290 RepID=UPI001570D615|nr:bifunctional 2-polyprenyl-6-hydroxyphenol methylase/3-demethylubiquinol 3-O-methyltransferase UbiG [Hyphomicrobium sulfonivorans]MBI1649272.1 bifunctional 2-polyprenyl-6-hydroxyphenol methylase/3-demethylubiquinol 3-O-methyltransferase UbiG [Hyphomicrobium sulfonivorans]NSL73321.1 bifunctional 2-polyprenyl-6-hydroxyphenol methylase/3-demethylubiquinol 3-O-methyltransferase UbiG [Hyphomicrobium sulfonivorans]
MQSTPNTPEPPPATPNLDPTEVERFGRLAAEWWDTKGRLKPLHDQGPARLGFIRDHLKHHFFIADAGLKPLAGLRIVDVGCGGGLVSEPLARLGATVTAIDPTIDSIAVARAHSASQGLDIDYRTTSIEELAASGAQFDAAVCMEVIEHVPDPAAFVRSIAEAVRPGGMLIFSTLNRTLKSYALAIVAAEYVLGWLPRGTHDWNRFVTTGELGQFLTQAGCNEPDCSGIIYDVMSDTWRLGNDTDVNYIAASSKPRG